MKAGQKIARGLLLARGDGSKMLDCIEKLLDDVTFAVAREVAVAFDFSICFGRDDHLDRARRQALD